VTVEELKQQRLVSRARDTAGSRRAVVAKHLPTSHYLSTLNERLGDFASTKSTGLLTRIASVDIVA
jgi:hypothetical protein